MAAEERECVRRAFEAFFSTKQRHSGLGLTPANDIVQRLHHGKIALTRRCSW
jgi:nitrogen-specific signal transduction histidine kinase